jgi:hypothetical protein
MTSTRCANCGAPIAGPYCAQCGQETTIALPTSMAFLKEAAGRYVALDGRMWRTLAALFFRPGFLTREYLAGRRRRYVRPGRLFLVSWLALFAVVRLTGEAPTIFTPPDQARERIGAAARDAPGEPQEVLTLDIGDFGKGDALLAPVRARLDAFNALPRAQKLEQLYGGMLRYGPYAMVALLPLFAGLLKVAYLGRGRRYPLRPRRYAAHLIYGAHAHAFVALALLVALLIPWSPVRTLLMLWVLAYLPWSLRTVYGGGWIGIAARVLVASLIYLFCFAAAMAGLVVAAVLLR